MNSESGAAHENAEPNNTVKPATVVDGKARTVPAKPTDKTNGKCQDEAYWHRRNYGVQLAIFVVGVIVAIIYICQLEQMRKSTIAATAAAIAAKESVKQTRETAHLDQRAWVAPISVT